MLKITPKNNIIEFQLEVENASLDNTSTRLVVEVEGKHTIIPLQVDSLGKCQGEIPLQENWNGKEGNIKLEVIAESTYFTPFEKTVLFSDLKLTPSAVVKKAKIVEKQEITQPEKTTPKSTPLKENAITFKSILNEDDSMEDEIKNFFKVK
jgi:hypothetical protein